MIRDMEQQLDSGKAEITITYEGLLPRLVDYFGHLQDMTRDYVKDEKVRNEQVFLQQKWKEAAEILAKRIG
jgi:hypothetical protein